VNPTARVWPVLVAGLVGWAGCTQTTELLAPSAQCPASIPIVHLGGTGDANCAGALASHFGRYALCSCYDLNLTGFTVTNSAGPDGGALGPGAATGGAVGVNGSATIFGQTSVDGTMIVSGPGGLKIAGGNLSSNVRAGSMATLAAAEVSGDAFVATSITGMYMIDGTLHLPQMALLGAEVQTLTPPVREPVSVPPLPCACPGPPLFAQPLVDVGGAVAERGTRNNNDDLPFADAFRGEIDTSQSFDWPCGEFYLPGIRTGPQALLEFRIHGRTGIFVAGDVYLGNSLKVTLDPGAELDLVVAGSVISNGRLLGAPSSPARMRLWIGSTTVSLPDQVQLGAVVYAPGAVLSVGVDAILSGSLFVQDLTAPVNGNTRLVYDPAAATAGASCGISPMPEVN